MTSDGSEHVAAALEGLFADRPAVVHDTIVLEQDFGAAPEQVWAAFESAESRSRWGVPSAAVMLEFIEADFRVGGRDLARCGPKADPRYRVETRYLDLVPPQRLVFSETVDDGARRLSAALITVELRPIATGTALRFTSQVVAFDGADIASGVRLGYQAAFGNLAAELAMAAR